MRMLGVPALELRWCPADDALVEDFLAGITDEREEMARWVSTARAELELLPLHTLRNRAKALGLERSILTGLGKSAKRNVLVGLILEHRARRNSLAQSIHGLSGEERDDNLFSTPKQPTSPTTVSRLARRPSARWDASEADVYLFDTPEPPRTFHRATAPALQGREILAVPHAKTGQTQVKQEASRPVGSGSSDEEDFDTADEAEDEATSTISALRSTTSPCEDEPSPPQRQQQQRHTRLQALVNSPHVTLSPRRGEGFSKKKQWSPYSMAKGQVGQKKAPLSTRTNMIQQEA